jgi:hypothetical protein
MQMHSLGVRVYLCFCVLSRGWGKLGHRIVKYWDFCIDCLSALQRCGFSPLLLVNWKS